MSARALMIAAPSSGAGKTVITAGLLRAFRRRGLRVRAAKSGPDYIDPAFHAAATGADALNLNSWAMGPSLLDAILADLAADADLVLVEAAMGLFDGLPDAGGPARRRRRSCRPLSPARDPRHRCDRADPVGRGGGAGLRGA